MACEKETILFYNSCMICRMFLSLFFAVSLALAALSENVESNFVESCVAGGSSEKFCECVFSKVEHKYSQAQIDAIELKMRRGKEDLGFSKFVKQASAECDAAMKSGASLGSLAVSEDAQVPEIALSPEEAAALEALGVDADLVQGFAALLLESPEYKNVVVAECAVELLPYLGRKQSEKICDCGYQKLIAGDNWRKLLEILRREDAQKDSLLMEMFLSCMPEKFTPELKKYLMDSCLLAASKKDCSCLVRELDQKFTLAEWLRLALSDSTFLQQYIDKAASLCQE